MWRTNPRTPRTDPGHLAQKVVEAGAQSLAPAEQAAVRAAPAAVCSYLPAAAARELADSLGLPEEAVAAAGNPDVVGGPAVLRGKTPLMERTRAAFRARRAAQAAVKGELPL